MMTSDSGTIPFSRKAIENIFRQKEFFIIIGLTGRTGSGCSTVASILNDKVLDLKLPGGLTGLADDEERDQRVVFRYIRENWQPFTLIKIRTIITAFILASVNGLSDLADMAKKIEENADNNHLEKVEERIKEKLEQNKDYLYDYLEELAFDHKGVDSRSQIETAVKSYIEGESLNIDRVSEKVKEILANTAEGVDPEKGDLASVDKYSLDNLVLCYGILPLIADAIHDYFDSESGGRVYTRLFQRIGNNIRACGKIMDPADSKEIDTKHIFDIAIRLNFFIKVLRHPTGSVPKKAARVVVDSFKNIFEITYMRDRYSAFYLMAISREDKNRKDRLESKKGKSSAAEIDFNEQPNTSRKIYDYFEKQIKFFFHDSPGDLGEHIRIIFESIKSMDDYESYCKTKKNSPIEQFVYSWDDKGYNYKELLYCRSVYGDYVRRESYLNQWHTFLLQDADICIQNADIFITCDESDKGKFLFRHTLARHISLILHPALVLPTPVERCMQIAMIAKANSGCLSRQVGAVVTDKRYNILSLGWNDVPCGQVSCIRRNLFDIQLYYDKSAYSDYEIHDEEFRKYIKGHEIKDRKQKHDILKGLPAAFCFKDCYQDIIHERDQIYTRALHAEERALADCSKTAAEGGYLFTTSSPCELCAKKAKDYKISKIYYIEQYPGISLSNIFNSGDDNNRAIYELFVGAIGLGYTKLYTPLMPYKDELKLRGFPQKSPDISKSR